MPFWSKTWLRPAVCTSETISASTSSLEPATGFSKTSLTLSIHSYGLSLKRERAEKTTGTYNRRGDHGYACEQTSVMVITIIILNLIHLRHRNKPDFSEAEIEQKHILIGRGYLDISVIFIHFSQVCT